MRNLREKGALRRAETQKWPNRLKPFFSNEPNISLFKWVYTKSKTLFCPIGSPHPNRVSNISRTRIFDFKSWGPDARRNRTSALAALFFLLLLGAFVVLLPLAGLPLAIIIAVGLFRVLIWRR